MLCFNCTADNEKRLDRKCRELEEELVQSTAKMAAALKLSADDGGAVLSLRKDLEKAWKLVDAGQEKVHLPMIAAPIRHAAFQGNEISLCKLRGRVHHNCRHCMGYCAVMRSSNSHAMESRSCRRHGSRRRQQAFNRRLPI